MTDVELVIRIPEKVYDALTHAEFDANLVVNEMKKSIVSGTPLLKGHGDLIDRSKLVVELECGIRAGNYEEGYEKYAHINSMDDCVDAVQYADTIVEADKETPKEEGINKADDDLER